MGGASCCVGHSLEHVGHTNIGGESDSHFGHGGTGFFANYSVRSVGRKSESTAHDEAVDKRNVGLGELGDVVIHVVFVDEELVCFPTAASLDCFASCADVATCTKGFGRIGINEHSVDCVVVPPLIERLVDDVDHLVS